MPAERNLPTAEAEEIVGLARSVAREQLAPRAAAAEEDAAFPRDAFRTLGELGFLGMPYPEEVGGAGQPYEVYLQALEEISAAWASVGVGLSVHVMSCYPLATCGTEEQRARWLAEMLAGDLLGGYCLSEADAGSDPAAMRTRAVRVRRRRRPADGYRVTGSKAWVTHGGEADFYTLFARTSEDRSRGISCFLVPGDAPGLTAATPERKMGLTGSTTATLDFDAVAARGRPADRRRGPGPADRPARRSTRAGSGSPPSPPASPRARSTPPSPTPRNAKPSAGRSSTTRASASCSPTWRRRSSRPAR